MTTNSLRIVFLGTHGQYNIGDELLLETFLSQLGTEHHYIVNSYDPAFTERQLGDRYDVELIDTRHDRRALLGHLRRCDALVFGGGSIVKELYASTGRNRYATLLMILATVTFANLLRRPIAMLNIGVGPITTRTGRALARLILRQIDLLTVRDPQSYDTCRSVGVATSRVTLATDAVFAVEPSWLLHDQPERASNGHDHGPLKVALNLNYDIENPANWELFNSRLAEGLRASHARQPIELHLLPMQTGFKDHDDATVLEEFVARLPDVPVVRHQPTHHEHVAAIVADCDVLVSERFHAIVIAALLSTPSLVLAYDVKVRELASMLDIDRFTIDINKAFESTDVSDSMAELSSSLPDWSTHVHRNALELHRRAAGNFERAREWVAAQRRRG
jgi:polysaccharide pyruvyl transferase CsaB